jgi:tRNA (guanine37-N1)-methyltransferase
MLEIHVLTLFPELIEGHLKSGVLGRAVAQGLMRVEAHQIRNFARNKHRTVDDLPYGGGAGMVMRPEPLMEAWEHVRSIASFPLHTVVFAPSGKALRQSKLRDWRDTVFQKKSLVLVCGRYEGIDQRFIDLVANETISLGEFVLSGGEVPALAVIDGLMRLVPGALGNSDSLLEESFSEDWGNAELEHPHYTRPAEFRGVEVPPVLLSGDHQKIALWRKREREALSELRKGNNCD